MSYRLHCNTLCLLHTPLSTCHAIASTTVYSTASNAKRQRERKRSKATLKLPPFLTFGTSVCVFGWVFTCVFMCVCLSCVFILCVYVVCLCVCVYLVCLCCVCSLVLLSLILCVYVCAFMCVCLVSCSLVSLHVGRT